MITKSLAILFISATILVLISQAFMMKSKNDLETLSYEIIRTYPDLQIRKYDSAVFASYTMPYSTYKQSSGQGFRTLAAYIFGKNEQSISMPMTSPVRMDMKDSVTMHFMLPSSMDQGGYPVPNNKEIKVSMEEGKLVAVVKFSGWANDEKIAFHRARLEESLEEKGIKHKNDFTFQGYNAPFDLVNRRNEIMVEIDALEFAASLSN